MEYLFISSFIYLFLLFHFGSFGPPLTVFNIKKSIIILILKNLTADESVSAGSADLSHNSGVKSPSASPAEQIKCCFCLSLLSDIVNLPSGVAVSHLKKTSG